MATDLLSTTRNNVLAIANAIPGLQNNFVGSSAQPPNTQFFKNLPTNGPTAVVSPTSGMADGQKFNGDFEIVTTIYWAGPLDTLKSFNDTLLSIDHYVALFVQALSTYSEFVLGGVNSPFTIQWDKPMPRTDLTPEIYASVITLGFRCVADQLSAFGFIKTGGQFVTTNGNITSTGL